MSDQRKRKNLETDGYNGIDILKLLLKGIAILAKALIANY